MDNRHIAVIAVLTMAASAALAQDKPCLDPCVPEAKRQPARKVAQAGAPLREQALLKLKQRFDDADGNRDGKLSAQEAEQGGFGIVAKHFAQIDAQRRGEVSFDELRRFLDQQDSR